MTNQERIQRRIARDKARKAERRAKNAALHGTFENVITMQNLLASLKKRKKGTQWKESVQRFEQHAILKLKWLHDDLHAGRLSINQRIRTITVYERGRRRVCRSVFIDSRIIQGVLCEHSIIPLAFPSLINDNPAGVKGKGVTFARRRLMTFIRRQIRRHGPIFYAFVYDIKGYFDHIRHLDCKDLLEKIGMDDRLVRLTMDALLMYHKQDARQIVDIEERNRVLAKIDAFAGVGATIGSQLSQDLAIVIPNLVDHHIKDDLRCKAYIRYMDDGIAICDDKDMARTVWAAVGQSLGERGLSLHPNKSHTFKSSRGFTFLKIRYTITDSGRVVRRISKAAIVRMRRKLKRLRRLLDAGRISITDVKQSFGSWYGNASIIADTYHQRQQIKRLYVKLFGRSIAA